MKKVHGKIRKPPAVFFDRDGTLIHDVGYLNRFSQIRFYPSVEKSLGLLRKQGFWLFVVTNQSGVARGFFSEAFVRQTHSKIQSLLRARGTSLDGFFYCPHHREGKVKSLARACDCRKPAPGMVRQAARRFPIDLKGSFMVGDKLDDLKLAKRAGLKRGILVRTGNGKRTERDLGRGEKKKTIVVKDLAAAARWILRNHLEGKK